MACGGKKAKAPAKKKATKKACKGKKKPCKQLKQQGKHECLCLPYFYYVKLGGIIWIIMILPMNKQKIGCQLTVTVKD